MIYVAILKISQTLTKKYGEQEVLVVPKPLKYQRRIKVTVPDEVVQNQETQPVLDAYAIAVKKPEWVGKSMDWYKKEQNLILGFHVISLDKEAI